MSRREPAPAGLVFDEAFVRHDPGSRHAESPERYRALTRALERAGLLNRLVRIQARTAGEEDLQLCHTRAYLAMVRHDIARRAPVLSTGDTMLCQHSGEVAALAAGAALAAVDAVMEGRVRRVFAAVRPPGHHATASRGMGFCIFNNAAIAARYARKVYGVDRILIADWDVHHGNGTQDIFYENGGVFFFSTHQSPWYPGTGAAGETGAGAGKGTTMNCPFPAGAGRAEVVGAFRKRLLPAMGAYRPGLVVLSAGFDSRRGDPLGRFVLRDGDFAELTGIVMEIAESWAGGRVVSLLEGGYDLAGLGSAAVTHVETLRGGPGAE
ncbi:MAG: histone deacetylase [Candidatus Solibacter usitatus]|nr:histone deacetylase [Candidatus Solibacter usitatus]